MAKLSVRLTSAPMPASSPMAVLTATAPALVAATRCSAVRPLLSCACTSPPVARALLIAAVMLARAVSASAARLYCSSRCATRSSAVCKVQWCNRRLVKTDPTTVHMCSPSQCGAACACMLRAQRRARAGGLPPPWLQRAAQAHPVTHLHCSSCSVELWGGHGRDGRPGLLVSPGQAVRSGLAQLARGRLPSAFYGRMAASGGGRLLCSRRTLRNLWQAATPKPPVQSPLVSAL